MVPAAQFLAYGNEGEGQKFAHQIAANLAGDDHFFFLAFACDVRLFYVVEARHGVYDRFGSDLLVAVLGYRLAQSASRKLNGDRFLVQAGGEYHLGEPALERAHVVAAVLCEEV